MELQATGLVHKCFHFFILTNKGKLLVLCKTFAISNPMFCACGGDNVRVDTFGAFFSLVPATSMEENDIC